MAGIIRVKEGAWFLGVCKGLEKSNRGSGLFWRSVFFISFCAAGFPIVIYLGLAIIAPIEKAE